MDNSIQKTTLYRYFDSEGQLLYVGITGDNTKRQSQHRRSSFWFGEIASASFEHFDTRDQALTAESAAIRYEKPLHNIAQTGFRLVHSPYVHMIHLAGSPDGGHDKIHSDFCKTYNRHFMFANNTMPDADMVVAFAMMFTVPQDGEQFVNLKTCSVCVEAYKSDWYRDARKRVKAIK